MLWTCDHGHCLHFKHSSQKPVHDTPNRARASAAVQGFEHQQFRAHCLSNLATRKITMQLAARKQGHGLFNLKGATLSEYRRCDEQFPTIREEPRDFGSEENKRRITRTVEIDECGDHAGHNRHGIAKEHTVHAVMRPKRHSTSQLSSVKGTSSSKETEHEHRIKMPEQVVVQMKSQMGIGAEAAPLHLSNYGK